MVGVEKLGEAKGKKKAVNVGEEREKRKKEKKSE